MAPSVSIEGQTTFALVQQDFREGTVRQVSSSGLLRFNLYDPELLLVLLKVMSLDILIFR